MAEKTKIEKTAEIANEGSLGYKKLLEALRELNPGEKFDIVWNNGDDRSCDAATIVGTMTPYEVKLPKPYCYNDKWGINIRRGRPDDEYFEYLYHPRHFYKTPKPEPKTVLKQSLFRRLRLLGKK